MTGFEPTIAGAGKWAAKRGYEHFTLARLERTLNRASEAGLTVDDLCRMEHRFAHFVTMVRALEKCSNNDMADYLVDLMIGGVRSGIADSAPDRFQLLLECLGSLTRTEVIILAKMRELRLFEGERGRPHEEQINELELFGDNELDYSKELLAAVINRMAGTGLVTGPSATYGGSPAHNSNRLSPLAQELFQYLDYSRRLT